MANNIIFSNGRKLSLAASHPTVPLSGKPCRCGSMIGLALVNEAVDKAGETSIDFGPLVATLSVKGVDDAGNSAVVAFDKLYYVDADVGDGTGFLSKKDSGYFAGVALAGVSSGQTATIRVLLLGQNGVPAGAAQAAIPAGFLKVALIAGGAAGNHTVTGIAVGDELVAVIENATAASIATRTNLTGEFSVTAADTINNTGGTDTTNDQLEVWYLDRT